MISYLVQAVLALAAWLVIRILACRWTVHFWVKPYMYYVGRYQRHKPTFAGIFPRLSNILHRLEDSRIAHATICFLTDFHEAQCFFIIAISSAIIHAQRFASANNFDSWESVLHNQELLALLSALGPIPVILTQLTLASSQPEVSIYSLLCSTVALIMAGISSKVMHTPDATSIQTMFRDDTEVEECGFRPSLRRSCSKTLELTQMVPVEDVKRRDLSPIAFSLLIVIGVFWAMNLKSRFWPNFGKYTTDQDGNIPRRAAIWKWTRVIWRFITPVAIFCVELWLVIFICHNLHFLAMSSLWIDSFLSLRDEGFLMFSDDNYSLGDMQWNLGQTVAILIWAPVLAKYLYTLLCKSNK